MSNLLCRRNNQLDLSYIILHNYGRRSAKAYHSEAKMLIAKRICAVLGGAVLFVLGIIFFSVAKGLLTERGYMYFSVAEFLTNSVLAILLLGGGIVLTVWACTPRRT
jgi:hypothetical protein